MSIMKLITVTYLLPKILCYNKLNVWFLYYTSLLLKLLVLFVLQIHKPTIELDLMDHGISINLPPPLPPTHTHPSN